MGYSAGVIIDQDDGRAKRKSGQAIILSGTTIRFMAEDEQIDIPLHGCDIAMGGTANKQAYVTHPHKRGVTLQVNDFGLFKDPAFDDHDAATNFRQTKKKHNFLFTGSLVLAACIFLIPLYFIFIERTMVTNAIVAGIPAEYDIKLGDIGFSVNAGEVIENEALMADLHKMVDPIIDAARKEPFQYNLYIVNDPAVNAFAVPGGHIVINSGLIEQSDTPEQMLGVVAHEIAHINNRHSMKGLVQQLGTWLFVSALLGDANAAIGILSDYAQTFSVRSFSRHHEHEADNDGFEYLIKAGIDPRGLEEFFGKLKEEEMALTDNVAFELFSTHPLTDDRIDALNEMMDKLTKGQSSNVPTFKKVPVDYDKFKENLRKTIDKMEQNEQTSDIEKNNSEN